jgi:putative transposase
MKLIAQIKLLPTPEQAQALRKTLEVANAACNYISDRAWESKIFRQFPLHKLTYYDVKEMFNLTAQVVVRCISKVADAYKLDRKNKRTFKPHGAIAFDNRILTYKLDKLELSIWTVTGRQKMSFACGKRQLELLKGQHGESDLCFVKGKFYLMVACDVETPKPIDVEGVLGIDMGIANIAVSSDGDVFQGKSMKGVRYRHRQLRQKLQTKGTKSSRRLLKKLSGKERRFATWVNHKISKDIVEIAKGTNRSIAIEDLGGIRARVTARRSQRATLHSWSFSQLRTFIEYKGALAGVPVSAVDPRNTSRTCPECGHMAKANRKSQAVFLCVNCGTSQNADYVASVNISRRAVVNQPNDSTIPKIAELRQGQGPRLSSALLRNALQ